MKEVKNEISNINSLKQPKTLSLFELGGDKTL